MSIIKTVTHPLVLAAAGGYGGHRWQGKKHPTLSVVGGAAAGLLAGYLLQRFLPQTPVQPTTGGLQQPLQGSDDADAFYLGSPARARQAAAAGEVEYAEIDEDHDLPSTFGADGEIDDSEIDELIEQAAAGSPT
jgi:hypothetical protein